MARITEPAINLSSFNCPHCGALAHQDWFTTGAKPLKQGEYPRILSIEDVSAFEEELDSKRPSEEDIETLEVLKNLAKIDLDVRQIGRGEVFSHDTGYLHISRCYSCKKSALWVREKIVYPLWSKMGPEPNEDLPSDIKADYDEARLILNNSPRGACALLRLCLQKICGYVGEKGKNINQDIESLASQGLPTKIVQAMDILRVTGNEAVHPGTMDIKDDRQTALHLCELLNLVAHSLITEPKQVGRLYSALPESKKRS